MLEALSGGFGLRLGKRPLEKKKGLPECSRRNFLLYLRKRICAAWLFGIFGPKQQPCER